MSCTRKSIIVVLTLLLAFWSVQATAQLANTPWPKPGKDARNTSCADNVAVAAPIIKWQVTTGHEAVFVGPIIDLEGNERDLVLMTKRLRD